MYEQYLHIKINPYHLSASTQRHQSMFCIDHRGENVRGERSKPLKETRS